MSEIIDPEDGRSHGFSPMEQLHQRQEAEPPEFVKQWLYHKEQSQEASDNQAWHDMKAYEIESQYEYDWQLFNEMREQDNE